MIWTCLPFVECIDKPSLLQIYGYFSRCWPAVYSDRRVSYAIDSSSSAKGIIQFLIKLAIFFERRSARPDAFVQSLFFGETLTIV